MHFLRAEKDCPLCVPPGDSNDFTISLRKWFPWKKIPSASWPFIGCCQPGATLCFQLSLEACSLAFNPEKAQQGVKGGREEGLGRRGVGKEELAYVYCHGPRSERVLVVGWRKWEYSQLVLVSNIKNVFLCSSVDKKWKSKIKVLAGPRSLRRV